MVSVERGKRSVRLENRFGTIENLDGSDRTGEPQNVRYSNKSQEREETVRTNRNGRAEFTPLMNSDADEQEEEH